jgi:hypothetical protein
MVRVWLIAGHENNCSGFIPADKVMIATGRLDWKDGLIQIQVPERRAGTCNLPDDIVDALAKSPYHPSTSSGRTDFGLVTY